MNTLEWWDLPRKAWILILTQSALILFLSSWLLNEYLNNPFMQQYLASLAPTIAPVLSLVFGAGAALLATTLYLRIRRVNAENERIDIIPRSSQARRASKKRVPAKPLTTKTSDDQQPPGLPTPQFIITESKPVPPVETTPVENKPDSPPPPSTPATSQEPEVKPSQ